ncbi:hypothetical protein LIER_10898 [Lithospermum erythrorhizon]|uniref:Reverse transcriptase zinc-binding domain-containing protein n=1 Tax=Lithospermum erythrorhizon TaxID=34254 RepID=A0AAV3PLD4_LITER
MESHSYQHIFLSVDAEAILKIPLPNLHIEDTFSWEPGLEQYFTVKSTYQLYRNKNRKSNAQPSSSSVINLNFRRMWKFKIPEKVKHFIWRGFTNSFPTTDNLQKRQIGVDPRCLLCGHHTESIMHIFNTCTIAKEICRELTIEEEIVGATSFQDLFDQRRIRLRQDLFLIWLICMWDLWYQRNLKLNVETFRSPQEVKRFATIFLANHQAAPK